MFDLPADTLPVWVGLAFASAAVLGIAVGLPSTAPPDASSAAGAVDAVAGSPHAATTDYSLGGADLRVTPHRLTLGRGGTTAHAAFAYGPVTPVAPGSDLGRVLDGTPPEAVFDSPGALAAAAHAAREGSPLVVDRATRLTVRHVTWRGLDVTLVGA
ncbi:DUF7283 family protein [Halomarina litorea]|uniref:DUF7283 family protein n=1 Tax=Halomarina litorea TaxID=2961595 RepID=UPI0020C3F3DE|nr:hypothetical protein [Halomarina sp. BCD28]